MNSNESQDKMSEISPVIYGLIKWFKGQQLSGADLHKLQQFGFIFPDSSGALKLTKSGEVVLREHGIG